MNKHEIYIAVAVDENNGIGKDNKLPWAFKKEMRYFTNLTTKTDDPKKQNMVIFGQKTWESLPEKYRPLPNRRNIVLTFDKNYEARGAEVATSFDEAFALADNKTERIFILGGGSVYKAMIENPRLTGVYLTKIHHVYDCDTFFPEIPKKFSQQKLGSEEEDGIKFDFLLFC